MAKLEVKALGLSCGIVWGASIFAIGIVNMATKVGWSLVHLMGKIYIGYAGTVQGSIIGAVWAFVDAGIGGALVAWLYNKFSK